MSDIKNYVLETVAIDSIRSDGNNPNIMSKERMRGLVASLQGYGYLQPVIVNKDGVIIERWEIFTGNKAVKDVKE